MLEDLNNVLNSGDIPNIYKLEDQDDIQSIGRPECQRRNLQPNEMNMFTQYVMRVKKNIHIIIAMSPVGSAFRKRLLMFPSLSNCCTIDWFSEWPQEALTSVAHGSMIEEDLELGDKLDDIVKMFSFIHKSVEKDSLKFRDQLRRINYVTPTSYLELLNLFKKVLLEKRSETKMMIARLENGLSQLESAEVNVQEMKVKMEEMKPKLAQSREDAKRMKEDIAIKQEEAEVTKEAVGKEEQIASKKATESEALKTQAEGELAKALPALDAAVAALKLLTQNQMVEVKSMLNPPSGVKLTMEVICIMFKVPPVL